MILAINPTLADRLYEENNFIENFTVVICSAALLLSLVLFIIRYKEGSGYGFWLMLSLFALIFVGDEISWGIGYFGLVPHKIAGIDFDGVHDILTIGVSAIKLTRDYILSIGISDKRSICIIGGSISAVIGSAYLLIKGIVINKERLYKFFRKNLKWEPFLFFILAIAIIVIAMVIDDDNLTNFPYARMIEESLELLAAAALLFSSISGFKRSISYDSRC